MSERSQCLSLTSSHRAIVKGQETLYALTLTFKKYKAFNLMKLLPKKSPIINKPN